MNPKQGWSGSFSSFNVDRSRGDDGEVTMSMRREVHLHIERRRSITTVQFEKSSVESFEGDKWKARDGNSGEKGRESEEWAVMTEVERGMGVWTKVWGP